MNDAAIATRFTELTHMKFAEQAKWYLNGFWKDGAEQEAEMIWKYTQKFIELDDKKKAEGCELDEFQAHKFLESLGETLTVVALREKLRKIDLDCDGKVALLEYLTFRYNKTVKEIINAPQGDNTAEINEATAKLQAVQDALVDLQNQLAHQQSALEASKKAEEESKKAASESRKAEEVSKKAAEESRRALEKQTESEEAVKKAESEQRAAVDDLKNQEENYRKQLSTLESKTNDPAASTVSKNKAAAELAQLKQEDPLPLRKAKITQEASLRKVEKERKAAEAATAVAASAAANAQEQANKAEASRLHAEAQANEAQEKVAELEEQTRKVEEAVRETEDRSREAEEYLQEVKKKGGSPLGSIWFMERELKEAQKYLPKKKQQQ